jgi:DNA excision repair protein ERCC-4
MPLHERSLDDGPFDTVTAAVASPSAVDDVADPEKAPVVDIVADVRERPSATFAVLASRIDVVLTTATLKFGDYSVAAQVSFERKTAEDLGRSIVDGRLFRQVSVLRNRVDRPVLLVEGLEPAGSPAGVPWHAVRGALVSVAVPILYSSGPEESAEIMVTAGRQLRRARSIACCRPGYRPKGWRKRALFILQGLPNIGPRRAQALLGAFGSIRGVMSATTNELVSVEGIGVAAAASIARVIGDEPPLEPPSSVIRTVHGHRTRLGGDDND